MVHAIHWDEHHGFSDDTSPPPRRGPHLIVFTSDEERTEIPMDLTPEEAKFLVTLAQKVNNKAKWSADIRMTLNESAAPTGEPA